MIVCFETTTWGEKHKERFDLLEQHKDIWYYKYYNINLQKDGGCRQKATRLRNFPLWVIRLNTISWSTGSPFKFWSYISKSAVKLNVGSLRSNYLHHRHSKICDHNYILQFVTFSAICQYWTKNCISWLLEHFYELNISNRTVKHKLESDLFWRNGSTLCS